MIITAENNYESFDKWLEGKRRVFLVCDGSIKHLEGLNSKLDTAKVHIVQFSGFQPNPLYESVVEGVKIYREEGCDSIIAVGGGSAIDVAKCVKLYADSSGDGANGEWLRKNVIAGNIPFLVMPTTAGTGSEATRYAVIYYKGVKQSITSESIIPDTVLMDPTALKTLPLYQKKATMCDALCHALESFWSVNSTELSRRYSIEALKGIQMSFDGYLNNTEEGNYGMLRAAHKAGQAINITQTTAGHAMCYKITSLFGLAHGHAALLCNRVIFPWMLKNGDKCIDPRGKQYLKDMFCELGANMGCDSPEIAAQKLNHIFNKLELEVPKATSDQYYELKTSVNPERLRNNPVKLDPETIDKLYHEILR